MLPPGFNEFASALSHVDAISTLTTLTSSVQGAYALGLCLSWETAPTGQPMGQGQGAACPR